jgi:hypothetical protein
MMHAVLNKKFGQLYADILKVGGVYHLGITQEEVLQT